MPAPGRFGALVRLVSLCAFIVAVLTVVPLMAFMLITGLAEGKTHPAMIGGMCLLFYVTIFAAIGYAARRYTKAGWRDDVRTLRGAS